MNVSIVIATYGSEDWRGLAMSRAYPSTVQQVAQEVIVEHQPEGTIAGARNAGARDASGDLLVFLDADDELAPGYVAAMRSVDDEFVGVRACPALLAPRVQYVSGRRRAAPKFWPEVDLRHSNWLVIGTAVPRALFLEVGGFDDSEHAYEDWSLFARCWKAGATIVKVPDAIYVAHVRGGSRNRRMSRREQVETHYAVGRKLFPEIYTDDWLRQHLGNQPRTRTAA